MSGKNFDIPSDIPEVVTKLTQETLVADVFADWKERFGGDLSAKYDNHIADDFDLKDRAVVWLANYEGESEFLLSVAEKFPEYESLTPGQVKAVLNSMVAEAKRAAGISGGGKREVENLPVVGYYGVNLPDGTVSMVRVSIWNTKEGDTKLVCSSNEVSNADREWSMVGIINPTENTYSLVRKVQDERPRRAVETLLNSDEETQRQMGEEYARYSSRCCICNRKLTAPVSMYRGAGPECALRFGITASAVKESEVLEAPF